MGYEVANQHLGNLLGFKFYSIFFQRLLVLSFFSISRILFQCEVVFFFSFSFFILFYRLKFLLLQPLFCLESFLLSLILLSARPDLLKYIIFLYFNSFIISFSFLQLPPGLFFFAYFRVQNRLQFPHLQIPLNNLYSKFSLFHNV